FALALACTLAAGLATSPPVAAQAGSSTAGRATAKRFAELGRLPDPEAIVVRDIVNYPRHQIPLPRSGEEVALDLRWDAPFSARSDSSVLQIGLATSQLHSSQGRRPLNLALVIDRSSSMAADDKMACVQAGLERFVRKL